MSDDRPPPQPPPPPPPPSSPPPGAFDGSDEPRAPDGRPLASSGLRVLARFLDGLIVGGVFTAVLSAIVFGGDDSAGVAGIGADASFGEVYVVGLLGVAVGFVWDAVCTKQFGGTPMKLLFGMRVVRADDGRPVEWSHAIKRWALPGALSLIPIPLLPGLLNVAIVIVSLVFLFTKPLRQAVWDLFAGTLVVKARG